MQVNACTPGWVRTDMGGANAELSLEEGAARVLTAVDEAGGGTGRIYSKAHGWTDSYW